MMQVGPINWGGKRVFKVPTAESLWQEDNNTFDKMRDFGKDGWELVSAVPIAGDKFQSSPTTEILFIYKRPVESG
jgi:hypothetical protein